MAKESKETKDIKEAKAPNVEKGAEKKAKKEHSRDKSKKEAPKEKPKEETKKEEIRHIVRIGDTDLAGKQSVMYSLTGLKGVSRRIARIVAIKAGLDPMETMGYLNDDQIAKLSTTIDSIETIIPPWMMNRQKDILTGEDKHLIGTDVMISLNDDLNLMKKMRSYKGIRHERGLKVRGQRTRSTGRKGRTVGVSKQRLKAAEKTEATKEGGKK